MKSSSSESQTPAWQQLATQIAAVKKTAWLPIVENKTGSVLNSKFSGIPLLDQNETWPCCGNCQEEMQLFLQLNSNELPNEAKNAFGDGLLQVFYCTNFEQECETECDAYLPFAKSTLLRIINPATVVAKNLTDSPVIDAFAEKVIVSWQATDDYPNYEELESLSVQLTDEEEETLLEQGYPKSGDKLLGWADWVQGIEYPQCPECGEKMKYIFQIDSEDHLDYMFGDTGCAHVTQCEKHPSKLAIAWACY